MKAGDGIHLALISQAVFGLGGVVDAPACFLASFGDDKIAQFAPNSRRCTLLKPIIADGCRAAIEA